MGLASCRGYDGPLHPKRRSAALRPVRWNQVSQVNAWAHGAAGAGGCQRGPEPRRTPGPWGTRQVRLTAVRPGVLARRPQEGARARRSRMLSLRAPSACMQGPGGAGCSPCGAVRRAPACKGLAEPDALLAAPCAVRLRARAWRSRMLSGAPRPRCRMDWPPVTGPGARCPSATERARDMPASRMPRGWPGGGSRQRFFPRTSDRDTLDPWRRSSGVWEET
jgi:hypothetical protein